MKTNLKIQPTSNFYNIINIKNAMFDLLFAKFCVTAKPIERIEGISVVFWQY